ncbi:uncharacterized protein FIBRA_03924 [Fibroporia radiculosa]|uniref:Uncharacterized protein n=1 Tax=Fibroporia radiculosa TaxID=599839 RepID=J4G6K1_9APHY|nr:uncharacterized protein FIBRA_03924 [Fibroporia radiculosa]CCM01853.1 predicted protein [Fibroporia radiculosa]
MSINFATSFVEDMGGPLDYGLPSPADNEFHVDADDSSEPIHGSLTADANIELVNLRQEKQAYKMDTSGALAGYANPFLNIIPYILISRFMLNLRIASESARTSHPSSGFIAEELHVQTISANFVTSLIGDMGGPLGHGLLLPTDNELRVGEDDLFEPIRDRQTANENIELVHVRWERQGDEMLQEDTNIGIV